MSEQLKESSSMQSSFTTFRRCLTSVSWARTLGMLPVLVAVCVGFDVLSSRFGSWQNVSIVLQQASINTVLAAGMTFVILTGGIDLSVGAILAASAMCSMIATSYPALAWAGVPVALVVGAGFGLCNGALIAGLRLPSFIVTLGTMTAVRGIARLIGDDQTLTNPDLPFAALGNGTLFGIPWLVLIALAVVIASWFALRRTVFGVYVYATGGNASASRLAGIRVVRILLAVYAISGLLAGLGGMMSVARLYSANGLQLGQSYELDAIAAVILGGTGFSGGVGSIWGTLIGALLISALANGLVLTGVPDVWQYIIKGIVIVTAVALDRFRQTERVRT